MLLCFSGNDCIDRYTHSCYVYTSGSCAVSWLLFADRLSKQRILTTSRELSETTRPFFNWQHHSSLRLGSTLLAIIPICHESSSTRFSSLYSSYYCIRFLPTIFKPYRTCCVPRCAAFCWFWKQNNGKATDCNEEKGYMVVCMWWCIHGAVIKCCFSCLYKNQYTKCWWQENTSKNVHKRQEN